MLQYQEQVVSNIFGKDNNIFVQKFCSKISFIKEYYRLDNLTSIQKFFNINL
jgi:hypothetical protein